MAMQALTTGQAVTCADKGRDRYGRTVATCAVDGSDLGSMMVNLGYALDWPKYSHGAYGHEQGLAQAAGRGAWSGSFDQPWDWRHQRHP